MLFEPERAAVCVTDLRGLGPNNGNQYDASVLEWPPGYWPERASFRLLDGRALPFVAIDAAYDQDGDVLHVTYASGALRVVVVND
jgi:hypothetical protein